VRKDEILPDYIRADDPDLIGLAETLIAAFQRHIGRARQELETELKDLLGTGTEFLLQRGLAKLLWDRCEFEPPTDVDPLAVRQAVFALAATSRQENAGRLEPAEVYQQIAKQLELEDPALVERVLYADLKEEQHVQVFKKVKPAWLLKRYNVALAQAVLFRAAELKVRIANQPAARVRRTVCRMPPFR
jgi:predicted nuclease of restriction endonuclease-like RecB superfamily